MLQLAYKGALSCDRESFLKGSARLRARKKKEKKMELTAWSPCQVSKLAFEEDLEGLCHAV